MFKIINFSISSLFNYY